MMKKWRMSMRRVAIPILTLCLTQFTFAADDPMRKTERQVVGSVVETVHLRKYEKDQDYLKKRAEQFGRSPRADARAFYDADARKIGPGTLVVEYTAGMCSVRAMTYSLACEGKTTDLEIKQIDWGKDEMTVQMPGMSARDAVRQDQASTLSIGESVNKHLAKLSETFGKGSATEKSATNALSRSEVMTWKVGDGYLEIETTLGAGIVKAITYVIGNQNEEKRTRIEVKDVDLTKGEMTIVIPGRSDKHSVGEDAGGKK